MARRPSDPTDDEAEGFTRRWLRLKQEARGKKPDTPAIAPPAEAGRSAAVSPATAPEEPGDSKKASSDVSKLPPIDSLKKESDYSVFMRADVPEDLRLQALRKLWSSDPAFAIPDPLDMHNVDYNNVPIFPHGVRTAYQIGKGMLDALADAEETTEKAAAAANEPAATEAKEGGAADSESASAEAPREPDSASDSPGPRTESDRG